MASISVDEVYKSVLAITNKTTGSFSPAEFNRIAKIVNSEIFQNKKKAYAINQESSEGLRHLITSDETLSLTSGVATTPATKEQIISIKCGVNLNIERVELDRWTERLKSRILAPSATYPVYRELSSTLEFNPTTITDVKITYLRAPAVPVWGYTVVSARPVYSVGASTAFEWPETDREMIVNMILSYVGISIREPQLTQFGELQEQKG